MSRVTHGRCPRGDDVSAPQRGPLSTTLTSKVIRKLKLRHINKKMAFTELVKCQAVLGEGVKVAGPAATQHLSQPPDSVPTKQKHPRRALTLTHALTLTTVSATLPAISFTRPGGDPHAAQRHPPPGSLTAQNLLLWQNPSVTAPATGHVARGTEKFNFSPFCLTLIN